MFGTNISRDPKAVRVVKQTAAPASVIGTAVETTLATITIPGGMMGANGAIRIIPLFSCTNSANNKTFKVKFGGVAYYSATYTTTATNQAYVEIRNRNAANSQVGFASSGGTATGFGISASALVTSALDTSQDQTLIITGTLANTGETITLEGYTVEFIPGA